MIFDYEPHRQELKSRIFELCDADSDGFLNEFEMRQFATYVGFDGRGEDWRPEYIQLCIDYSAEPSVGIPKAVILELLDDRSDMGAYCSSAELSQLLGVIKEELPTREEHCRPGIAAPVDYDVGRSGKTVFFTNVSFNTKPDSILAEFRTVGRVSAFWLFSEPGGKSRGMGLVQYVSSDEACRARESLSGAWIDGRQMIVKVDKDDGRILDALFDEQPQREQGKDSSGKVADETDVNSGSDDAAVYPGRRELQQTDGPGRRVRWASESEGGSIGSSRGQHRHFRMQAECTNGSGHGCWGYEKSTVQRWEGWSWRESRFDEPARRGVDNISGKGKGRGKDPWAHWKAEAATGWAHDQDLIRPDEYKATRQSLDSGHRPNTKRGGRWTAPRHEATPSQTPPSQALPSRATPSQVPKETHRVFFAGAPTNLAEQDIKPFFEAHGPVHNVSLFRVDGGLSCGMGYTSFSSHAHVSRSLEHGVVTGGVELFLQADPFHEPNNTRRRRPRPGPYGYEEDQKDDRKKVFFTNVPYDIKEEALWGFFGQVGNVRNVIMFKTDGYFDGRGVVEFGNEAAATRAWGSLHNLILEGRKVQLRDFVD